MNQSTETFLPWSSSLSIVNEDDFSSSYGSTASFTPPDTPLQYKPVSSTNPFVIHSPPLSPEQCQQRPSLQYQIDQKQQQSDQQQSHQQQLQLLQSIPHSINIQLNDFGLSLDTNFTDIARLRNYLLSFVLDLPSPSSTNNHSPTSMSGQLVPRNKRYRNKPVNLFQRFYELGQLCTSTNGKGGLLYGATIPLFFQQMILRQHTVIACIHTYFDCWVRYFPVFPRQQILAILDQPRGLDSVLLNAIACFVLKHMFAHHRYPLALEAMRRDPAKIRDMEEFFFNAAKHSLEKALFDDDNNNISRFDIMGMLLMSYKVDMKKKSIYMAMAVQSLQSLQIQPGDDSLNISKGGDGDGNDPVVDTDALWERELDTRLWWMAWMNDFAVSSSGISANMPSDCCQDGFNTMTLVEDQQQQQNNRRRRVPRLWSFDCDGASEYGIMVNEHCLSIWRMQAEIVQHQYNSTATSDANCSLYCDNDSKNNNNRYNYNNVSNNDDSNNSSDNNNSGDDAAVDYDLLESFDRQLNQFLQCLPADLQPNVPYDATPISLVRARVHLELNATRIILHKLYIPDDDDESGYSVDSVNSLRWQSLNICLQAAQNQVKTFHHCVMDYPSVLRCGFDRDELWRATEIISVALDFLDRVSDESMIGQQILHQIGTKETLLQSLNCSLTLLQHTYELRQCNNTNFRQLEDWLRERIQYHHNKQHLANHNNSIPVKNESSHYHHQHHNQNHNHNHNHNHQHHRLNETSPMSLPLSSSNLQNSLSPSSLSSSLSSSSPSPSPPYVSTQRRSTMKKRKSSAVSSTSMGSFDQQISFASGPCVFTSSNANSRVANSSSSNSTSFSSSQNPPKTRFRYFSPKQNQDFLFIDENPVN